MAMVRVGIALRPGFPGRRFDQMFLVGHLSQVTCMQSWLLLGLAIVLEVVGTVCMKLSDGFTQMWPALGVVVFYLASTIVLAVVVKTIDISIAYAVWAGLGIVLITIIGVFTFNEPLTWLRVTCIGLIIVGVVGLNLSGTAH